MNKFKEYFYVVVVVFFIISCSWAGEIPKIMKLEAVGLEPLEGVLFHLQCQATGDPWPEFEWSFNEKRIEKDDPMYKIHKLTAPGSVLTVNVATEQDSGKYRCYATNSYGTVFAEEHVVIKGLGEFAEGSGKKDNPVTQNVTLGKPFTLTCPHHSDKTGQLYTWALPPLEFIHPGRPIEHVFMSDDGRLIFSYITEDDIKFINRKQGVTCVLLIDFFNAKSSVRIQLKSDGAPFTNDYPPEIVVFTGKDSVAVEGEKKDLLCGATGRPHPEFKWYKDGVLIPDPDLTDGPDMPGIYFDGKGLVLKIAKVNKKNAGVYKCVASNSEGTAEIEGRLTVHSKVKMIKELKQQTYLRAKGSFSLACEATGFPAPKYEWYHNTELITPSSRTVIKNNTLKVKVSDFADTGMYSCVASNYLNTVVSSAYVKIRGGKI